MGLGVAPSTMTTTAIIAGIGPGFGESFAWRLASAGYGVGLFARTESYVEDFAAELREAGHDAVGVPTDVTDPTAVESGVAAVRDELGPIELLSYQASGPVGGAGEDPLDADRFRNAWEMYALGIVHCANEAIPDMRELGSGTILCFGATPDTGDYAYAGGKAAARALARRLAATYGPDGIHVAHVVIAGGILNPDVREGADEIDEDAYMAPAAVTDACMALIEQDRSAWTFELDLRPHVQEL